MRKMLNINTGEKMRKSFDDLSSLLNRIVSTSELNRGLSKKMQELAKDKLSLVVVKNNKPQAVLMSLEEYNELMEMKEDFELYQMAVERMKNYNPDKVTTFEELLKEEGISKEEIEKEAETIEIE